MTTGIYEAPEPYQNLQLGLRLFQNAYLMYKGQNAPEDRLELLRQWVSDAQALLAQAQPPMPPQAPPAGAAPGPMAPPIANPVAAPTSPIMPINPAQPQ